jgi:hypothetical protein
MIVRIRLRKSSPEARQVPEKVTVEELAHGAAMLLVPVYLSAWAMTAWRLGADMRIMGPFFVTEGVFSHWQVWFTLAIAIQAAAKSLRNRKSSMLRRSAVQAGAPAAAED